MSSAAPSVKLKSDHFGIEIYYKFVLFRPCIWLKLKSDHFGIEIQNLHPVCLCRRLKSDHFGIEIYPLDLFQYHLSRLKSDHFGIEIWVINYD